MDSTAPRASVFGDALQDALLERGLSLTRVQAHLAAAGHSVAPSTISQWQRGHRLPRSERSLAVVEALEQLLRVESGSLRALIPDEGIEATPLRSIAPQGSSYLALAEQLGAKQEATELLSTHDRVQMDAHGAQVLRRTTGVLRAVSPIERHVVAHCVDQGGDIEAVAITARRGCRLGRVLRDESAGVMAAELHFDRVLAPGDTAVYEVQVDDLNGFRSRDYYRWCPVATPMLVVEAGFSSELIPTTVQSFHRPRLSAPDQAATDLALERGDRVHLVCCPAEPGVHGIRWSWPE